jgi:hypothetical protein
MKLRHLTIRLDETTCAIIEKYGAQFGTKTSETVERLIQAADGKNFLTLISTAVARPDELSFLAGQLVKVRLLWREVKSRLNVPRPLDSSDTAAVSQYQTDRARIETFYKESTVLQNNSQALCALMTAITQAELKQMQTVAFLAQEWVKDIQTKAAQTDNAKERSDLLESQKPYTQVVEVFHRLGIEPVSHTEDGEQK